MIQQVEFSSFDGTKLFGKIESIKDVPIKGAVLLLHGCPSYMDEYGFYSNSHSDLYPNGGMAEILAKNGFISLRFNYRYQDKDISPMDMNDLSISGMISDTEAAYWKLEEYVGANIPVYVFATSFAGGFVAKWINTYQRSIKKLFLAAPLLYLPYTLIKNGLLNTNTDMAKLNDSTIAEIQNSGYIISGGKKVTSVFANEVMQINQENEFSILNCNTVIFHGDIDTYVPLSQSKCIVDKFKKVKLIVYHDEGNGFVVFWDRGLEEDIRLKIKAENLNDLYNKLLGELNEH